MKKNNIISFPQKMESNCVLTEVFCEEARNLLNTVMDVELEHFLLQHRNSLDDLGRPSVVRNGFLPQRKIHTGVGEILIRVPRVRDRNRRGINFRSKVIPGYLKKTNELTEFFPWYYLQGKNSGNFFEALKILAGSNSSYLSERMCGQLKEIWKTELDIWKKRGFSSKKYSHYWIGTISPSDRLEKSFQNILVVIGLDENDKKELLEFQFNSLSGHRPWKSLLTDLIQRGLRIDKDLVIGSPSLDFWEAWREVYQGELVGVDKKFTIANK